VTVTSRAVLEFFVLVGLFGERLTDKIHCRLRVEVVGSNLTLQKSKVSELS
jgi:hypothetical protein